MVLAETLGMIATCGISSNSGGKLKAIKCQEFDVDSAERLDNLRALRRLKALPTSVMRILAPKRHELRRFSGASRSSRLGSLTKMYSERLAPNGDVRIDEPCHIAADKAKVNLVGYVAFHVSGRRNSTNDRLLRRMDRSWRATHHTGTNRATYFDKADLGIASIRH